ncbi:MAG TPA: S8 family serine peptidase [Streptosporangiaceae bacterium]
MVAGLFAVVMVAFAVTGGTAGASSGAAGASTSGRPADMVRAQEWWLSALGAPQAWRDTRGGGVTVAVLSTGVAANSPDLSGSVITGPDYSASSRGQGGPYWGVVGTAVASIIAGHGHGSGGNSGVSGIAPQAKILSVRVNLEYNDPLNNVSTITRRLPEAIATGIMYAVSHGARVIDLPLDPATFGLSGDSAAQGGSAVEQSAIRYALARNVVLVAPGGDDGSGAGQMNYPAAYPGVLAVGAVGRHGQVAMFSSRRSYVALTAPGVGLLAASMVPGGLSGYTPGYSQISTTSVASAMVAGAAALVVSRYPGLTPTQVTQTLRQSAAPRSDIVNAANAVRAAATLAAAMKPPVVSPTVPPKPRPAPPPVRHATAAPRAASDVVGSVLREVVFGLAALIAFVIAVLFVTQARRKRTSAAVDAVAAGSLGGSLPSNVIAISAAHARSRGLHEHRRPGRGPAEPGGQQVRAPRPQAQANSALRQLVQPGSPAASGWPVTSDWQGRSLGEVAHSSQGQSPLGRPAVTPLPKSGTRAIDGASTPPWAPAPEPEGVPAPFPMLEPSPPTDISTGIRVPGDVPTAFSPLDQPEPFGDGASQPGPFGSDLSGPFTGRDVLTQAGFGFAAAPVPADYPSPPEVTHTEPGESTEVFPVIPGLDGDADTTQPNED